MFSSFSYENIVFIKRIRYQEIKPGKSKTIISRQEEETVSYEFEGCPGINPREDTVSERSISLTERELEIRADIYLSLTFIPRHCSKYLTCINLCDPENTLLFCLFYK